MVLGNQDKSIDVQNRHHQAAAEVTALRSRGAQRSDAELVFAARGGDESAQHALYLRHAPHVLQLATRLLDDQEEAKDVLQDSFVTALERLTQLEEPAAFSGWLRSIAVRLVHRRFRRKRWLPWPRPSAQETEAGLHSLARPDTPPDVLAELALIDTVLRRIPSEQRIAWILRHVEGESLDSAAALIGCSLATVKRRIAAAQARLDAHTDGRPA